MRYVLRPLEFYSEIEFRKLNPMVSNKSGSNRKRRFQYRARNKCKKFI